MNYEKELSVALAIAKEVGLYQLKEQSSLGKINLKEDRSPFTKVDVTSEKMIQEAVLSAFAEDGFLGEESGEKKGSNNRRWIVDPLDGTRPYIHNIPTFSVLIALEEGNEIVAGVCHFPALNETYYATKGGGAFCDGKLISVSKTANISDAMGTSLGLTETAGSIVSEQLFDTMVSWEYVYGFMDAYSYMSVAAGKLDICVSLIDFAWDRGPAAIIIKEAGGRVSDFAGDDTIYSEQFLVTNGLIHEEALEIFRR